MTSHRTLLERIAWRAARQPDRVALCFEGRPTSFARLWESAGAFAGRLVREGLGAGDRVVVAVPNGAGFFTAFYGIQRAGGVPVPVLPVSGAARLSAVAERCEARLLVAGECAEADPEELVVTHAAAGRSARSPARPGAATSELAYIQYTSGSTGDPKGVQIRHDGLLTNIRQMIAGMEITESDVFVSWLPVHHDMGLVLMTMVPLYLGARLFLLPTSLRHPGRWLDEISRRRATFTAAPDFGYRVSLRRVGAAPAYDLASLRVALNAAEPVRRSTLEAFESRFGLRHVMTPAYGLAEATVGVSTCRPGDPVRIDARGVVSVGRPFRGVEIEISADGRAAAPGEIGEILVSSPANTEGYWNDARATRDLIRRDGYLRTGDLGYLDRGGELFVVGRTKNLIIQGGRNIAPREVEEAIDPLPFVRASAAVGIDRGGDEGEQIYAFVELRGPFGGRREEHPGMAAGVVAAVRDHLGLRPGRVYLVRARTLPRTANGKVRYPLLLERYLDGGLRQSGAILYPGY